MGEGGTGREEQTRGPAPSGSRSASPASHAAAASVAVVSGSEGPKRRVGGGGVGRGGERGGGGGGGRKVLLLAPPLPFPFSVLLRLRCRPPAAPEGPRSCFCFNDACPGRRDSSAPLHRKRCRRRRWRAARRRPDEMREAAAGPVGSDASGGEEMVAATRSVSRQHGSRG
jgi:hypothetical protein